MGDRDRDTDRRTFIFYLKKKKKMMFTAGLFTTAKTQKQQKCLSINDKSRGMWCVYTHTHNCYSDIKKNELMSSEGIWMNLENMMLSDISQTEKDKYIMLSHTRKM